MATAGSIKAGEAYVEIGMDTRSLDRGLASARQKMEKFGKAMRNIGMQLTAVGAAILTPLALATKSFASYGDSVAKMARRTGLSTKTVSELGYAAKISGTDMESLEKGVRRMARTISDAQDGLTTYTRAFERIGLTAEEFRGMSPEEAFLRIGRAIEATEDPMIRAAAAQEIFGRAGTRMIPMFDAGAGALDRLRERAHDLGLVLSRETAQNAEEVTDAMEDVRGAVRGLAVAIGAALAPALTKAISGIVDILSGTTNWARENPLLSKTLLTLTAVVGGLAVGLGVLALAIWGVTAAINVLSAHPIVALVAGLSALIVGIIGYEVASRQAADATGGLAAAQEAAAEQAKAMEEALEKQRKGYADLETQVRDTTTAQVDWAKKLPAGKTLRETTLGKREERAALMRQQRGLEAVVAPRKEELQRAMQAYADAQGRLQEKQDKLQAAQIARAAAEERKYMMPQRRRERLEAQAEAPLLEFPSISAPSEEEMARVTESEEEAAKARGEAAKAVADTKDAFLKAQKALKPYAVELRNVNGQVQDLTKEIEIQQTVLEQMGAPQWLQKIGESLQGWWQSMFGELDAARLKEGDEAQRFGTAFGKQLGLGAGGVTAIPGGGFSTAADPVKQQVNEQKVTNTKLDLLIEAVKESFGLA